MKKRVHTKKNSSLQPISWLPIDSRLFPFLSFGHVKGVARLFLQVEIVLAVCIVVGTMSYVFISVMH